MPPINTVQIPHTAFAAFVDALRIPPDALSRLVGALADIGPTSDVEDLAKRCAPCSGVSEADAGKVITLGINMSRIRRGLSISAKESLARVLANLKYHEDWRSEFEEHWDSRATSFEKLIEEDGTIDLMSKARELLFEFQCVLLESAVLTDVRYVFDAAATNIKAGLIQHTISLRYLEGASERQIHINMAASDITQLVQQLERAKRKAVAVEALLERAGLPELSPQPDIAA